jgi:hypothetical protein
MTLTDIRIALLVVATAVGWTLSGCNSREPTAGSSGASSTIGSHAETTAVADETPPAAASSGPDYGRCRACAHASVCACGDECMRCLYIAGGGENCPKSASYYRDACSCLRMQCPGDCPPACNR